MAVSVDINDVIGWLDANEAKPLGSGSSYTDSETAVIQRCLDAAVDQIETAYTLPATWTQDIELAVIMQTARLLKRRATPEGTFAVSDFGTIRMSGYDPDVSSLLAPYKSYRFAQSQETIDAA